MLSRSALILAFLVVFAALEQVASAVQPETAKDLVYFNEGQLLQVKAAVAAKEPYFFDRYARLLAESDLLLADDADPVVNKTMVPPSGDMHDYLSYAPYRWPDESKKDGLPWKAIDGVTNPVSRRADTDYMRLRNFADTLEKLSFAYYFSRDTRYADRGAELLKIWFVDSATRVNPNINFGQAVPGLADGRPAGLIEWSRISTVITAMQIFERGGVLPEDTRAKMLAWMDQYLNWLLTSQLGKEADALPQNHANWYNYQVVGLMIYLGKLEQAKAKVEDAKRSRIAAQITPDGRQPLETGRTKSMHYSTMNLWALTNLTFMGRQVGIDLWDFETEDGRSLRRAYRFLAPYALGDKDWPYKQIAAGGAREAIKRELKPLFSKSSTLLGVDLLDEKLDSYQYLSTLDALRYPPQEMLPRGIEPTE